MPLITPDDEAAIATELEGLADKYLEGMEPPPLDPPSAAVGLAPSNAPEIVTEASTSTGDAAPLAEPVVVSTTATVADAGTVPGTAVATVAEITEPPVDDILNALMARIKPINKATFLKACIYGPPGTGKTVWSMDAPKPLLVDIDKGSLSLFNHPHLLENANVLEFRSVRQVELLAAKLAEGGNALTDITDTIIIDKASELSNKGLALLVGDAAAKDMSRNPYLAQGPEYNINGQHMTRLFQSFRDLPMNVIFICDAKEEKDQTTGAILNRPDLAPKLSQALCGMVDVVGYLTREGDGEAEIRSLRLQPTNKVVAKCRIGNLPDVLTGSSFRDLLNALVPAAT